MLSELAISLVESRVRCQRCASQLTRADKGFTCRQGHKIPVNDGYVDISTDPSDEETQRTLESFGYEWTSFDRIEDEDEDFWKRYFRGIDVEDLHGKSGLDAGCGKGRFTYFVADHLESVVALDGSAAVESAVRNLSPFENVAIVKADLVKAPLAPASFDFIWCLGVLHHLSDPRLGFAKLAALLAPSGRLLVYVYSRSEGIDARRIGLAIARGMRSVTTRLPHPLLKVLSRPLAFLLYAVFVLPGAFGDKRRISWLAGLPLGSYRQRPVRSLWLDTFDRLSAPIENRYTWADIEPWFRDERLTVESVREDAGLIVLARKTETS